MHYRKFAHAPALRSYLVELHQRSQHHNHVPPPHRSDDEPVPRDAAGRCGRAGRSFPDQFARKPRRRRRRDQVRE